MLACTNCVADNSPQQYYYVSLQSINAAENKYNDAGTSMGMQLAPLPSQQLHVRKITVEPLLVQNPNPCDVRVTNTDYNPVKCLNCLDPARRQCSYDISQAEEDEANIESFRQHLDKIAMEDNRKNQSIASTSSNQLTRDILVRNDVANNLRQAILALAIARIEYPLYTTRQLDKIYQAYIDNVHSAEGVYRLLLKEPVLRWYMQPQFLNSQTWSAKQRRLINKWLNNQPLEIGRALLGFNSNLIENQ